MGTLIVNGGRKLEGDVFVHGSKNSILPILAATILNSGISVIHNCPKLRDVDAAIEILRCIGCRVEFENGTVVVDSKAAENFEIPDELMREMRSSVIFMGAMIARLGKVSLFAPGGCELGARPIDLHISALRALGTEISEDGGAIRCRAHNMRGNDIVLSFPSVGATENAMLTACACSGKTRIINAAREPEIEDLQNFLIRMGADVSGAGSSTITIRGRQRLHDVEYTVIPDRICAATFMCAAAMCGGKVRVNNVIPEHVSTVTSILNGIGCDINVGNDYIDVSCYGRLSSIRCIRTMPYPGFPTDAQPPLMALATRCEGVSVFVENIFDGRYRHVGGLLRLGADIRLEGRVALVSGVNRLCGCPVEATDLRGGAALVVAALAAEGTTEIGEIDHIDRGYEMIEKSFQKIGADIIRT